MRVYTGFVYVIAWLLCFATLSAQAATPNGTFFSALHWRCIGPFRGGRTVAVSGVRGYPERFYFGAVGGGVWRTDNAGNTWSPIFDAQSVASIGALAVADSDPNVIYVGSGEADFRSDLQQGDGMYKSIDAGRTWQHIGLTQTRAIGRISIDPSDAADVVVAALGHPYGPNAERGIFRTRDGGKTWRRTLFLDANTGAITVTRDPQQANVLFAALLQTRRPPWNVYAPSKGPSSGLYTSTDGGDTWQVVTGHGFPSAHVGRIGIAIAPTNSSRVYAVVDATNGGLYRSDNAGHDWQRMNAEHRIWQRGWYFSEVSVDPHDSDIVYISNTSLYRSTDGGVTVSAIKGAPGGDDYHMLWIDPADATRMILASDQGATVSVDGARTWSSWYNQPTAQIYHVATDTQFPFRVYGAQQDSGAISVPSRSFHRGIAPADALPLQVGGESDNLAPDPLHPGIVFGSRVAREDLRTRTLQDVTPTLASAGKWRATWTLPLSFSAAEPSALYFGRQVLFRTSNGGANWHIISPDLTRERPAVPANLDPPAAADADSPNPRRGVIYTIAPSPLRARTIWTGTDDGNIVATSDGGRHWRAVTPRGLTAWSKVAMIEASHFNLAVAYAAVDRHRLDDSHPYIYRTTDAGRTWRNVAGGIPDGSFVNAVREDPQRPGLVYAGTETGVFVSFNAGGSWKPLRLNMPPASVRDLTVRADALVIATHGRSFWILDELAPLRQYAERARRAVVWLFDPQPAYRIRPADDDGTPFPPETPAGENPPDGAIIDYSLGAAAKVVTLDITDAAGHRVRHWSSSDRPARVDARTVEFPAFWLRPAPVLASTPGLHRFVWDLRYAAGVPPAAGDTDDPLAARGIWAAPGRYHLRMRTDDGHTSQRFLAVKIDPRERVSDAALNAQFQFARTIEALRATLHPTAPATCRDTREQRRITAIDAALAEIQSAEQSAPHAPTRTERQALVRQQAALAATCSARP